MKRKIALVALALVLCAIASPGSAAGYGEVTRRLARGVHLTVIKDPSGPYVIRVVSVNLARRSSIDVALSNNKLPALERTSAMARRHGALVAINGDYARPDGRPVFSLAEDGWLAQSPLAWGRNFAVNEGETAAHIGHAALSMLVRERDSGTVHSIERFNEGAPGRGQIAAFTPAGGTLEAPPLGACSARLLPLGQPRADPDTGRVAAVAEVAKARCAPQAMARRGGIVLATPRDGRRAAEISRLVEGERITLTWSFGWPAVLDAIGGNPTLVEAGRPVVPDESGAFYGRNPRTAVGYTGDGHVLLVVVDGRQPGYSVGMTVRRLAHLLDDLGAQWALNLDGGGSSTMWVRGRGVVNRPSDGSERMVSSALLLLPGGDTRAQLSPQGMVTHGELAAQSDDLAAIATDPASTGGLANALRSQGRLPGFLRPAANAFASR